jgi:hypothetical protein
VAVEDRDTILSGLASRVTSPPPWVTVTGNEAASVVVTALVEVVAAMVLVALSGEVVASPPVVAQAARVSSSAKRTAVLPI